MVNTHQKYSRKIQTTKVQTENKDYRRPRHYRREEIEEAIQVEQRPEGGGPRQYRREDIEEAIEVEQRPEGGGPRQYRREGVEGCRRVLW